MIRGPRKRRPFTEEALKRRAASRVATLAAWSAEWERPSHYELVEGLTREHSPEFFKLVHALRKEWLYQKRGAMFSAQAQAKKRIREAKQRGA